MLRLRRGAVALAASLALVSVAFVAVRSVDGGDGDQAAADYVNAYRATRSLLALTTDDDLDAAARRWVEHLAGTGTLSHDRLDLGSWTTMGENVGSGRSIEVIQRAFEASPSHELNLVGAYTHLGAAVAARGDLVWVVQRFAASAAPAAPAVVPTTLAPVTTTVTLAPVLLCRKAGAP